MANTLNSKSSTIVLITYEFPFGSSETFIETEIKYLEKEFSKVFIVPARAFFNYRWMRNINQSYRPVSNNVFIVLPSKFRFSGLFQFFLFMFYFLLNSNYKKQPDCKFYDYFIEIATEIIKSSLFTARFSQLVEIISESQIIYSYWKATAAAGVCLLYKLKRLNLPIVTRCHGGDLYYNLPPFRTMPFDKIINKYASCILPISDSGLQHLAIHGFNKEKLVLSRLGVQLPNKVSSSSDDSTWRIVSCSNVISIKRVPLIAQSLAIVNHNIEWHHFGDGYELKDVINETKNFPNHIKAFLWGRVPNEKILSFYQNQPVDLFINLSVTEGVPVSIMEALSVGIPCIATNVGGVSEILNEKVGKLLPVSSTKHDVASAIITEMSNHKKYLLKRMLSRRRAFSICSAEVNYMKFIHLLKNMVDDHSERLGR